MPSIDDRVRSAWASNARAASYAARASVSPRSSRSSVDERREDRVEPRGSWPYDPANDGVHPAPRVARGVQQRGQALLGGHRPEVPSLDAALVELAGGGQAPGHLEGAVPGRRARRAATTSGAAGRLARTGRRPAPGRARGGGSSVVSSRSVLIDEASTGPFHSSSAGTARPADLPDCGGPNATSACRRSARSSRPRARPSPSRGPLAAACAVSSRSSRGAGPACRTVTRARRGSRQRERAARSAEHPDRERRQQHVEAGRSR